MTMLTNYPPVYMHTKGWMPLIKSLQSKGCIFEPSTVPAKLIKNKNVSVETMVLIQCLKEIGIQTVRVQFHGLKAIGRIGLCNRMRFKDGMNRVDYGRTIETGDIRLFKKQPNTQLYPMFLTSTGTLKGTLHDMPFKVYSTLIHHLKHRSRKIHIDPRALTTNSQIRTSLESAREFLSNFESNHLNLGFRI